MFFIVKEKVFWLNQILLLIFINLILEGDCNASEVNFHGADYGLKSSQRFQRQNENVVDVANYNNNEYPEVIYNTSNIISNKRNIRNSNNNDETSYGASKFSLGGGLIDRLPRENLQANEINAALGDISHNSNGYHYDKPIIPFEPVKPTTPKYPSSEDVIKYTPTAPGPSAPDQTSYPSSSSSTRYTQGPSTSAYSYPSPSSSPSYSETTNSITESSTYSYPSISSSTSYTTSPALSQTTGYSYPKPSSSPSYSKTPSVTESPYYSTYPSSPSYITNTEYSYPKPSSSPSYSESPGTATVPSYSYPSSSSSPAYTSSTRTADSNTGYSYPSPSTSPTYSESPSYTSSSSYSTSDSNRPTTPSESPSYSYPSPSAPTSTGYEESSSVPTGPSTEDINKYPSPEYPNVPVLSSPSPFMTKKPFEGYDYSKPVVKPNFQIPSENQQTSSRYPDYTPPSSTYPSPPSPSQNYLPQQPSTIGDSNIPSAPSGPSIYENEVSTNGPYFSSSPSPFSPASTPKEQQLSSSKPETPSYSYSQPDNIATTEVLPTKSTPPPLLRKPKPTTTTPTSSTTLAPILDDNNQLGDNDNYNNAANIPPQKPQEKFSGYDYPRPNNPMTYPPPGF